MRENGGLNFYRNLMLEFLQKPHEARGHSGSEQDGSEMQAVLLLSSGLQIQKMSVRDVSLR